MSYSAPHSPRMRDRIRRPLCTLAQEHRVSFVTMKTTYQDLVWEVISRQYAQYHKDVMEEWQVMNACLGSAQLGLILGCFSNLLDFKIVKGTVSLTDNGKFSLSDNEIIKENIDGINSIPVSSDLDLRTRGEGLWQGCVPSRAASYLAFRTSMTIFAQNPNKIKELEINHLPWQLLQRSNFLRPFLKAHTDSWALT
jgi:hypothetical protein